MKALLTRLHNRLKWLVAPDEMRRLECVSVTWNEYRRWLAEFPDIATALDNFAVEAWDTVSRNAGSASEHNGPWTLQGLREVLRRRHAIDCRRQHGRGLRLAVLRLTANAAGQASKKICEDPGYSGCWWPECGCASDDRQEAMGCPRKPTVIRDAELSPHTTVLNPRCTTWPACDCAWNQPCVNLSPEVRP